MYLYFTHKTRVPLLLHLLLPVFSGLLMPPFAARVSFDTGVASLLALQCMAAVGARYALPLDMLVLSRRLGSMVGDGRELLDVLNEDGR